MQDRYAVIVGTGRSGTTWLLNIFNHSAETLCRNEPDVIPGSPFAQLPARWVVDDQLAKLEGQWDEAVAWTRSRMGNRDLQFPVAKRFMHGYANRTGLASWPARRKLKRFTWVLDRSLSQGEWRMPGWLGSQEELERAYAVLKINAMSGWATWLMPNRPQVPLMHIARHPGGTLNSYRNRYLNLHDAEEVTRVNRERVRQILSLRPEWSSLVGDVETMDVLETELWYWRYVTQSIHEAGQGRPNYIRIVYEDLVQDPAWMGRKLYERCSLPWTAEVERKIRDLSSESTSIAKAWRQRLSAQEVEWVDRVLHESPMESWWAEEEVPTGSR